MATESNNKTLNVPNKRVQNQTCLCYAERAEQGPQGNVPNLRFPEFNGEWIPFTLGEISDITKLAGFEFTQYVTYEDCGKIIALRGLNCKNGKLDLSDVKYIDNSNLGKLTRSKLYIGDILFTYVGTVGEVAIIEENDKYYLAPNVSRIRLTNEYDPYFVKQMLHTNRFYNKIILPLIATSSQPALSMENVRKFKLQIPSITEQQKISSFLSLLDERIATQIKIIEKLESLIKGLTDGVFSCNSSFPMVRFSNLYKDAGEGGTPSTSNSEYYEGGNIPFVKIDDLTSKYLVAHKDCITEQGMKKSSAWLIPSGSVIYSNGATIGSISINTYPVCTKQGILGIIPKDNVDVEYLYYLMTSVYFRKEIYRIITEGTMKTAYLKDINNILCPMPDLDRQKSIANKLAAITKKIELEQQALSSLQKQKKYLLSNLFI